MTFTGVVKAHSFHPEPELAHVTKRVGTIPPSPFGRGKGEGRGNREKFTLTSVLSQRERKQKRRAVKTAGVAGQTALSGSQIKPPALPEVHDYPSGIGIVSES